MQQNEQNKSRYNVERKVNQSMTIARLEIHRFLYYLFVSKNKKINDNGETNK